ncbi:hypothetical protein LTR85_011728 [Meristemomyces frigidus]|nr:hypothetical protein LTR85_011728 [Meristemomyces frigidus]
MDSPGAFPDFNYAFQPVAPVALTPQQLQNTLLSTRARVTFGNLPTRPRGEEPKFIDNFGHVFSLRGTRAGKIAQRRRQAAREAAADEMRDRRAAYACDRYLETHPELVMFRTVDFQQQDGQGREQEPVSPRTVA